MEQERIFTLIARKLSGDASSEDLTELDQMVIDIPELGTYLETLEQDDAEKVELAYQQMNDALDKQNHLFFIRMSEADAEEQAAASNQTTHSHESSFTRFLRDIKKKFQRVKL